MSTVEWIRVLPQGGNVIVLEMQAKDDFDVARDQPLFEYMFETCVNEARLESTVVSVCVDARKCNFLSYSTVPAMLSRFISLVNRLHAYPVDGVPTDIVSGHLGSTAIVIGSETAKMLVNMIVSMIPTRRPVEFFTNVEDAVAFGRRCTSM
jgi:hypothetical protein